MHIRRSLSGSAGLIVNQINCALTLSQHCCNRVPLLSAGAEISKDFCWQNSLRAREALLLAMDHLEAANKPCYPDLIYVVEDDPDVSQLIEHNLRTAGYEVSTFFSGAPVVPMAVMSQPALFLLD